MQLINIGFGNIVSAKRIVAIVSPDSAPIKRVVQEAKDNGNAVDATYGRRTRAVLIMDSGHIILSAVQPETVASRLEKDEEAYEQYRKWRNVIMMVKPTTAELLAETKENKFGLVIATAKRARQIASGSKPLTDVKEEAPVTIAANELGEGKVEIIRENDDEETEE